MTAQTVLPKRFVVGRLKLDAEPGTILGPKDITREWMVVLDRVDGGVSVGYATVAELEAALQREPRSVAEVNLQRQAATGRRP
jgi:hypothetical protein